MKQWLVDTGPLVEKPESIIRQGQPPLDFAADFARMKQSHIGLRNHFKKTGNRSDRAKVTFPKDVTAACCSGSVKERLRPAADLRHREAHFFRRGALGKFALRVWRGGGRRRADPLLLLAWGANHAAVTPFPKRALVRLRDQLLITKCTEIRDLAMQARDESGAAGRGITTAKITALTAAIALFDELQRKPRTSIGGSATKRRELETGTADLIEQLSDLDDLNAQLEPTDPNAPSVTGRSPEAVAAFIADWKRQRKVIEAGHGPTEEIQPPTPPAPPTA